MSNNWSSPPSKLDAAQMVEQLSDTTATGGDDTKLPITRIQNVEYSDMTVSKGQFSVRCHKHVICGQSEVIRNDVNRWGGEGIPNVNIGQASANCVVAFLLAMYDQLTEAGWKEHALDIVRVAQRYKCRRLLAIGIDRVIKEISVENFWEMFKLGGDLRDTSPALLNRCLSFVATDRLLLLVFDRSPARTSALATHPQLADRLLHLSMQFIRLSVAIKDELHVDFDHYVAHARREAILDKEAHQCIIRHSPKSATIRRLVRITKFADGNSSEAFTAVIGEHRYRVDYSLDKTTNKFDLSIYNDSGSKVCTSAIIRIRRRMGVGGSIEFDMTRQGVNRNGWKWSQVMPVQELHGMFTRETMAVMEATITVHE